MDISKIIAFEDGELNEEETIALFQDLIDSGAAWTLQGSYGRLAASLISTGHCTQEPLTPTEKTNDSNTG